MPNVLLWLKDWLTRAAVGEPWCSVVLWVATAIAVFTAAALVFAIARCLLGRLFSYFALRTRTQWDDALVKHRAVSRVAHFLPGAVIHSSASFFPAGENLVQRFSLAYIIFVGLLVVIAFLNAATDIYETYAVAKHRPIRSFVDLVKIALSFVIGIVVLAMLLGHEPWLFLSGLGAMTAVLMLVFKDSLLGLVAGIQLTLNDMVAIGDWIEMSKYGADGDVIEISLHTVKVRNWDKSITTIPSYALVSDSFKNWRGMSESGARRIKRSLSIDMTSIRYCTPADIDRLARVQLLSAYLDERSREIAEHNDRVAADTELPVNGRRMTNIGVFRAYVTAYLRKHPKIHQDMTLLVRHLDPTPNGLPVEIYVFANDHVWANYEGIQADIFDHLLAAVPLFDLRVFQAPSGGDLRELGKTL